MTADDELEQRLLDRWTPDELAVYADRLIDRGDVRGELIALDLAGGRDDRWQHERTRLLTAWLGAPLAQLAAPFVRYGFLEDLTDDERSRQLLDSPAGDFVRAFQSQNDVKTVQETIERLAARPRPWLTELTIHLWSDPITNVPRLDDALVERLIAHTPRLRTLDLSGRIVARRFAHPSLRDVRLSGNDALREIAFPAVRVLDHAFHRVHRRDTAQTERAALHAEALPALTTLDLSRNEPGRMAPHALRGELDVSTWLLGQASILPQLEHVILPALGDEPTIERVAGLVTRMPRLVEARVARTYRGEPHRIALERLRALRVTIPAPRPWPRPLTLRARFAVLAFEAAPEEEYWNAHVDLGETFAHLDTRDQRDDALWGELWTWYGTLGREASAMPRALFQRVIAAGGELLLGISEWRQLAALLRNGKPYLVRRIRP